MMTNAKWAHDIIAKNIDQKLKIMHDMILTHYPYELKVCESAKHKPNSTLPTSDALPSHGGETQARVSQSQVAELGLGSTLPASNSGKG